MEAIESTLFTPFLLQVNILSGIIVTVIVLSSKPLKACFSILECRNVQLTDNEDSRLGRSHDSSRLITTRPGTRSGPVVFGTDGAPWKVRDTVGKQPPASTSGVRADNNDRKR